MAVQKLAELRATQKQLEEDEKVPRDQEMEEANEEQQEQPEPTGQDGTGEGVGDTGGGDEHRRGRAGGVRGRGREREWSWTRMNPKPRPWALPHPLALEPVHVGDRHCPRPSQWWPQHRPPFQRSLQPAPWPAPHVEMPELGSRDSGLFLFFLVNVVH